MKKNALIVLMHCVVNIVIQMMFFIRIVFFYDYTVSGIIGWTAIGISLTVIDCLVCKRILRTNGSAPWIIHSADLVLLIPNIALLCLVAVNKVIVKPSFTHYEITWIIGVILVDFFLILGRIYLIKLK